MKLRVKEICIFSMFGALMLISKKLMEFLPNIHLIAVFIAVLTLVYRKKAIIPIYIYVLLDGLIGGFSLWWIPYLYIWAILWAAFMLMPKGKSLIMTAVLSTVFCGMHGLLFGTLYAPFQALAFGYSFKTTLAWIASGLPFDAIHAISNVIASVLIIPLVGLICKLDKRALPYKKKEGHIN